MFKRRLAAHALSCGAVAFSGVAKAETPPDSTSQSGTATAQTEVASESGPEFSARLGYAIPFGRFQRGERLQRDVAGAMPMWVDVGYRFSEHWFAGVYGQYGVGIASATSQSACPNCEHSWVRLGAQVQYRWVYAERRSLWVGLGIGQEIFNTSIDSVEGRSRSTRGWELFNAQFGCDWEPTPGLGIGPYFSFALATFSERTERCSKPEVCPPSKRDVTVDLAAPGMHGWVNAGLRVVLLP